MRSPGTSTEFSKSLLGNEDALKALFGADSYGQAPGNADDVGLGRSRSRAASRAATAQRPAAHLPARDGGPELRVLRPQDRSGLSPRRDFDDERNAVQGRRGAAARPERALGGDTGPLFPGNRRCRLASGARRARTLTGTAGWSRRREPERRQGPARLPARRREVTGRRTLRGRIGGWASHWSGRVASHKIVLGLVVAVIGGFLAYIAWISVNGPPFQDRYKLEAIVAGDSPVLEARRPGPRGRQARRDDHRRLPRRRGSPRFDGAAAGVRAGGRGRHRQGARALDRLPHVRRDRRSGQP